MKAVIMAGGEGTRLRPITLGLPKPMVPLLGRPVMEHIIGLLKRHGITDICVTLQYMPEVVQSWFGDGAELGVRLTYFVEREPLGTAGSVKNCMSHLGEDDFLVISGGCRVRSDLSAAMGFHRASRADATLVLYRHPEPLEYGLVLTDDTGRVERFIEKSGWSQVFTNTVNTGIYLLTRRAMDRVPEGRACDFGKDLFRRFWRSGAPLYGHIADGYWCDMGDCGAYLAHRRRAGARRWIWDFQRGPGIWAAEELPGGITVVLPRWIGPGASIEEGMLLPLTAVGPGFRRPEESGPAQCPGMENAKVAERCTLYAGTHPKVSGAAAQAEPSQRGRGAGSRGHGGGEQRPHGTGQGLAGEKGPEGGTAHGLWSAAAGRGAPVLGDGGVIRGTLEEELESELLDDTWRPWEPRAGWDWDTEGGVSVPGCWPAAPDAARRRRARRYSSTTADVPRWGPGWRSGTLFPPPSLWNRRGRGSFSTFSTGGGCLSPGPGSAAEGALLRGEVRRASADGVGAWEHVTGTASACAADAARRARYAGASMTPVAVSVPGETPADRLLRSALEELGCVVLPRKAVGVPGFAAEYGGLRLAAWDEEGTVLPTERVLALVSLIELENGGGRVAPGGGAGGGAGAGRRTRRGGPGPGPGRFGSGGGLCRPSLAAGRDLRRSPAVCPSGPDGGTALHAGGAGPCLVVLRRRCPGGAGERSCRTWAEAAGAQNGEGCASRTGEAWCGWRPQPPGCDPGRWRPPHWRMPEARCAESMPTGYAS